jgi:S1-C subfamily serine protease
MTARVDLVQTDAPISPGISSGALVDSAGRAIGISEAYSRRSRAQSRSDTRFQRRLRSPSPTSIRPMLHAPAIIALPQ